MITRRSPVFDPMQITPQLDQAIAKFEEVHKKHKEHKEISAADVKQLLPVLENCNQSLTAKKASPDQALDKSIERLLQALDSFQFIKHDKTTQEKVNALQTNLFANFVQQMDTLHQTLKGLKEEQRKVQKSNQSKST